ncbi:MAG: tetratricopeptide repeat protein [Gammaproteobacteria bacterium]
MKSLKTNAAELIQQGRFNEAVAVLGKYVSKHHRDVDALFQLADVHGKLGAFDQAEKVLLDIVAINPALPAVYYALGIALHLQRKMEDSAAATRKLLAMAPAHFDGHFLLSRTYFELGQTDKAAQSCRAALAVNPGFDPARNYLAYILENEGRLDEAEQEYRELIRRSPQKYELQSELGLVLRGMGRLQEALDIYRNIVQQKPSLLSAASNMALCSNYMEALNPASVADIHRQVGQAYSKSVTPCTQFTNAVDEERQLRVGYISPDLRLHSVAYFFEPLLANLNKESIFPVCYADVPRADAVTRKIQGLAGGWRSIYGKDSGQVAQGIIDDRIDILVDLAGHTGGNRLQLFARRVAPVQFTYLGYPNTTGLTNVDFRVTDHWADPVGADDEHLYTEQRLRLKSGFLCYQPSTEAPDVALLPARSNGYVTFGSFNNLAKMGTSIIVLWARILLAIPGSRLLLKNKPLGHTSIAKAMLEQFESLGVAGERVEFAGSNPDLLDHLSSYGNVDISLDTFPYNGTTTTCEALWMGVPVVTLAGVSHVARVGHSLLSQIDKAEWVGVSADDYVDIAVHLGANLDELSSIRGGLRNQMWQSLLCNGELLATEMEEAYRTAWRKWCATQ